ncbi:hypothetical protein BASA61_006420 [Batrachochytrium salamandrivorans]|nr:hypothetical protein BASA61_006420 [Batrachochytrium salamandrivorans]
MGSTDTAGEGAPLATQTLPELMEAVVCLKEEITFTAAAPPISLHESATTPNNTLVLHSGQISRMHNLAMDLHHHTVALANNKNTSFLQTQSQIAASILSVVELICSIRGSDQHAVYLSLAQDTCLVCNSVLAILKSLKLMSRYKSDTSLQTQGRDHDSLIQDIQIFYKTASKIAIETLMTDICDRIRSGSELSKEPAICTLLMHILKFTSFAYTENDMFLLNHGWRCVDVFLVSSTTPPSSRELCDLVLKSLEEATCQLAQKHHPSNTTMLNERSLAAHAVLAKFFLAHFNHLMKNFHASCILQNTVSLFISTISNILFVVTRCTLTGAKSPNATLFSSICTTIQYFLNTTMTMLGDSTSQPGHASVSLLIANAEPPETFPAPRVFYTVKSLFLAGSLQTGSNNQKDLDILRSTHPTNTDIIHTLMTTLELSDARLLVYPYMDSQSIYTDILVAVSVHMHRQDAAITWPILERILWQWLLKCTLPTTWLLIADVFGHIHRYSPKALSEYPSRSLVIALTSRLCPGSPLASRIRYLAQRLNINIDTAVADAEILLLTPYAHTRSADKLSNTHLANCLVQWQGLPRKNHSDHRQGSVSANENNGVGPWTKFQDSLLADMIDVLAAIWTHICSCLDIESDVDCAVREFQRLTLVAVPLARISEWNLSLALCRRFPKSAAKWDTLLSESATSTNIVVPLVLYIEGASGAIEHSLTMRDADVALCLTLKSCIALVDLACGLLGKLTVDQIHRLLISFDGWLHVDSPNPMLVDMVLVFIQRSASRNLHHLEEISRIIDRTMQLRQSSWLIIHHACQAAIAVASVSPLGAPKLSPSSRALVQALLSGVSTTTTHPLIATTINPDEITTLTGCTLGSMMLPHIPMEGNELIDALATLQTCLESTPLRNVGPHEQTSMQRVLCKLQNILANIHHA